MDGRKPATTSAAGGRGIKTDSTGRRDPRQNHYPELDLAEHDRGIASRRHAIIDRDGDYYTIVDLGSTNGTRVNGALLPANQPQRLRTGDRIKIGEVEIEFRWN